MADRETEKHQSEEGGLPVQTEIEIPGLMPGVLGRDGHTVKPDNLEAKLPELRRATAGKPWLPELLKEVLLGKKKGVFTISPGRLIITVAAAALGVEFGIRGGRDLKELWNSISHPSEKKDQSG